MKNIFIYRWFTKKHISSKKNWYNLFWAAKKKDLLKYNIFRQLFNLKGFGTVTAKKLYK